MNENMLPVGTVLRGGTYRIEKQISSGGFGNTYVVRNISFDEVYAMKEFFMKGINLRNGSDVTVSITDNKATFESQRKKFKTEAKRLRKLDNPHIVKVHDLFEENRTVYYVMDLINGRSLNDIVKDDGPMDEKTAKSVFRQMLEALSAVHSHVHSQDPMKIMLHLDIKPSNIMLDKSGNAFLLDFGSSKLIDLDNSGNSTTGFTFTPSYAPPELIDGNKDRMGPWTDLYGLGATLYHILTGQKPPIASEILENGESAFSFPQTVSSDTRKLILWLMTLAKASRPKSAREVQERIGFLEPSASDPTQGPKPTPSPMEPTDGNGEGTAGTTGGETTILNPNGTGGGKEQPTAYMQDGYANTGKVLFAIIIGIVIAFVALNVYKSRNKSPQAPAVEVDGTWQSGLKWVQSPQTPVVEVNDNKQTDSQLSPIIQDLINNMVYVEGGTFTMGATSEQGSAAYEDEKPAHQVTVSSYYIGKYEVTQEQWQAVMGSNPSSFKGEKRPVESVSWNDCQGFIRKLNSLTGKKFRLPSEAEWEFAARGGNGSKGYKYSGSNTVGNVAWYTINAFNVGESSSNFGTHNVGTKSPNELGLYDMSGNVHEWCQDWYGSYSNSSQTNPKGPSSGDRRMCRGGGWVGDTGHCRVSNRDDCYAPGNSFNNLGLRLAL